MAYPVNFEGSNKVYVVHGNENDSKLPVKQDGQMITSAHRLTPEEIAKICETGVMWLTTIGESTPPLRLHVDSAFVIVDGENRRDPICEQDKA